MHTSKPRLRVHPCRAVLRAEQRLFEEDADYIARFTADVVNASATDDEALQRETAAVTALAVAIEQGRPDEASRRLAQLTGAAADVCVAYDWDHQVIAGLALHRVNGMLAGVH